MSKEIERKFLIDFEQVQIKEIKPNDIIRLQYIEQTYLSFNPEVRIRKINNGNGKEFYYLTVKSKGDMIREEFETQITNNIYYELLKKSQNETIIKQRYEIELEDGLIAELDQYKDFEFNTIEVEFENEEQAYDFLPPEWFGEEVTKNCKYKNRNLVKLLEIKKIKEFLNQ